MIGNHLARPRASTTHPSGPRTGRLLLRVTAPATAAALLVLAPGPAYAAPAPASPTDQLHQVIANLQGWLVGILAAVATLYLVVAGVYYATAGGDPQQVDKAKNALKNALVGYAVAVLAPALLQIVQGIVGG